MASSALVLHRGAVDVGRQELDQIEPPPPVSRWYPVKHACVLDRVKSTLVEAGYCISKERFAVTGDGHRFFGTLDLTTTLADGVALAVGIRNSTDKTFPLGFTAGSRVFVCDNLAFRSELMVRRKHTLHGERSFGNAIGQAVTALTSFKEVETMRIAHMQATPISAERAESFMLRAYLKEIVALRFLPEVLKKWRSPLRMEGEPTLWRLLQAFTSVMSPIAKRNPNDYAVRTMRLQNLLLPAETMQALAV
jgi:hypothetical protein